MKRFTLGLAAVALTSTLGAYAAMPAGQAFQVDLPNVPAGWLFSIEGNYLQPSNSGLNYGYTTTQTLSGNTLNRVTNSYNLDPGYSWGFALGVGYIFPNSSNDVQLHWTHLNMTDNDSVSGTASAPVRLNNGDTFVENALEFQNAYSDIQYLYNAIDLDVGQYVNFGCHLTTRWFAGLRYAQIERQYNQFGNNLLGSFQQTSSFTSGGYYVLNESKFNGIGPRFGVESYYHLGQGFGVVGRLAATVLAGRVETDRFSSLTFPATQPDGSQVNGVFNYPINSENTTRVVPGVDAKLGFDYSYPFNNGMMMSAELGWQFTHYVDPFTTVANTFDGAPAYTNENFGYQGPYLTLSLKI